MLTPQVDEQVIISEQIADSFSKELHETITLKETLKSISLLAFPTVLFSLCIFLQQTINLIFIGRYYTGQEKEDVTEAVGLSHLYINCLMLSITIGLISGFETLGANAYGAGKYKLMGVLYHRAQLIGYIYVLFSLAVHFFLGPFLIGLTTDNASVVNYVRQYMRVTMFFVFFEVHFGCNFRYINIIDKPLANLIPIITTLALHPLWCYLFIIVLDLGMIGGGFSLIISQMLNAVCGIIYINVIRPLPESIFWYNKKSFKKWWKYIKFSLPSCMLTCADWWGQEILAIVAMAVGNDDYYAHIVIANLFINTYSISFSFGISVNILIGTYMGKGDVKSCTRIRNVGLTFGVSVMFVVSILLFSLKTFIVKIFNVPDHILDLCYDLTNIVAIANIFDISQTILAGVLRGYGKQLLASIASILNYYLLQIGLACLLGLYFKLGVRGIWYAMLICSFTMTVLYTIIVFYKVNLDKIRMETFARIEGDVLDISRSSIHTKF